MHFGPGAKCARADARMMADGMGADKLGGPASSAPAVLSANRQLYKSNCHLAGHPPATAESFHKQPLPPAVFSDGRRELLSRKKQ